MVLQPTFAAACLSLKCLCNARHDCVSPQHTAKGAGSTHRPALLRLHILLSWLCCTQLTGVSGHQPWKYVSKATCSTSSVVRLTSSRMPVVLNLGTHMRRTCCPSGPAQPAGSTHPCNKAAMPLKTCKLDTRRAVTPASLPNLPNHTCVCHSSEADCKAAPRAHLLACCAASYTGRACQGCLFEPSHHASRGKPLAAELLSHAWLAVFILPPPHRLLQSSCS